ncbi:MAG: hypothetical protein AAF249_07315 [Pseudomonadota bacterium]
MADPTFAELTALSLKADENAMLALSIFMTVVSGFLVMSYAIGAKLTRRQCALVVPLFVFFAGLGVYASAAYATVGELIAPDRFKITDDRYFGQVVNLDRPLDTPNLVLAFGIIVIIACLAFFRDIRVEAKKAADDADE